MISAESTPAPYTNSTVGRRPQRSASQPAQKTPAALSKNIQPASVAARAVSAGPGSRPTASTEASSSGSQRRTT